jgi:DNA polymerase-1
MESAGATNPKILVVGEAPGSEEDYKGVPFVGPSGQLLREVLAEAGFDLNSDIRFTNIVRCRPPDNKLSAKAIKACKDFAWEDIKAYKPEMVFLMGNSPLDGILGEKGISNWNGIIVHKKFAEIGDLTFVPLYHPAYILRDASHTDEWLEAIIKATDSKIGETDLGETDFELIYPSTMNELYEMEKYLNQYEWMSYDTETHHKGNALDAFAEDSAIVSVSFGAGEKAYAVPLFHPEAPWSESQFPEVIDIITSLLESHSGSIIGHNLKFDMIWTAKTLGYWTKPGGDSMLISHMLDSVPGERHGLKRLAGIHLGMYEYNEKLEDYTRIHPEANPKRGGSYAFVPWEILREYGALDAKATLLLHDKLYNKLSKVQRDLYHGLIIPATEALSQVQFNGLKVDKKIARRYTAIYTNAQKKAYEVLLKDPKVKRLVKDHQAYLDTIVIGKRKRQIFTFNPGSSQQLCELYFDYYHIPPVYEREAGGKPKKNPTTKAETYKHMESKYPILKKTRYWKLLSKMLSTYLRPASTSKWTSDDDYVHTTFNQTGTVTSRLSSSDPVNLQNIPTKDKEPGTLLETLPIKNIFTHTDWIDYFDNEVLEGDLYNDDFDSGAIVNADYSGMELRCFASVAKCNLMIAIHKSGLDFHKMVAGLSKHMLNQDDVMHAVENKIELAKVIEVIPREVRYVYKWTNWTILFGGDEHTLHHLYDVPLDDAKETIRIYLDTFPEVKETQDTIKAFAHDNGYVESPFGRREYLPRINDYRDPKGVAKSEREAVNMPIQSTASDTVVSALVLIHRELKRRGWVSRICNEVHDSIMGDCPRHEIIPYTMLVKDMMENVKAYAKIEMPKVNFDWLICPLKADIEIGTHYGSTIDFDDWIKEYGHDTDTYQAQAYHYGITTH